MEFISTQALISINETAIVQLISFLIFLFIINRVMFRPLRQATSERERYVEGVRQDIVKAEEEVEHLLNRLDEKKSAVREEAFGLNIELEAQANKQAEELLTATRQEIESLKAHAEKEIDFQIGQAKENIMKESDSLVVHIMEQILNRRLVT
jgi:F-type H+-transporting ATPase subunit b